MSSWGDIGFETTTALLMKGFDYARMLLARKKLKLRAPDNDRLNDVTVSRISVRLGGNIYIALFL